MSLLSMIAGAGKAADRIGIVRPTSVISSVDVQVQRLLGCADEEGKALSKRHGWQAITKEQTFVSTATTNQTGVIPSDFDRFINETFFDRTLKRQLEGPLTPQEWQVSQSVVATTIVEAFRVRGSILMLTPTPAAGNTYAFEYVSKNWCQSAALVEQSSWASDTDTGILDEEIMTEGIIWRFLQKQGFDYAESFRTYELMVAQAITSDGAKRTLNAGRTYFTSAHIPTVPDGNWPL